MACCAGTYDFVPAWKLELCLGHVELLDCSQPEMRSADLACMSTTPVTMPSRCFWASTCHFQTTFSPPDHRP